MKISIAELDAIVRRAILSYGYTEAEAATIQDVLMYAQLRGNNQGLIYLIGPGMPNNATGPMSILRETPISALINSANNHAMVTVNHAVDVALSKTRQGGVGIVGVNQINTPSGAIGYYARRLAEAGFVGVVCAGSSPMVAPHGSSEPVFGTNPLSVAFPMTDGVVVLDMATSAIAFFGIQEAKTAGRDLPPNVALDDLGRPVTDPEAALSGALRTFDRGARGSGLSFMVQALTGPLLGASFAGIGDVDQNWGGHLVLAFDPELLGGAEAIRAGVRQMVDKVKDAKPLPGVDEIFVPGERGDRKSKAAIEAGEIEIEDNLYRELKKVSEAYPAL
jgi:L-2-hydroxycarboxylate dehydrogenase (NAD+)